MSEVTSEWSHAQNDALGYFLWLFCKLARQKLVECGDLELLLDFPRYFAAIQYWQDEDNGHWEETPKVNASSIGTVLAGLRELRTLVGELSPANGRALVSLIQDLEAKGQEALQKILPRECISPPSEYRPYDAALLFLIYPLEVIKPDADMADRILADVTTHLQGDHGIRRYLGDSYWCGDYDLKYERALRAADVSGDMSFRDALLRPGEEAQWCLFDPILSAIHGQRCRIFRGKRDQEKAAVELARQTRHLNRALGQLTKGDSFWDRLAQGWQGPAKKPFACPEAYFLRRGQYVPNDQTPLLWTQANLWIALHAMQENAPGTEPVPGESRAGA